MRLVANNPATRTGVCVVRAEHQPSGGFLISVTTNVDISHGSRIEMSANVVTIDQALTLVKGFLDDWAGRTDPTPPQR